MLCDFVINGCHKEGPIQCDQVAVFRAIERPPARPPDPQRMPGVLMLCQKHRGAIRQDRYWISRLDGKPIREARVEKAR